MRRALFFMQKTADKVNDSRFLRGRKYFYIKLRASAQFIILKGSPAPRFRIYYNFMTISAKNLYNSFVY